MSKDTAAKIWLRDGAVRNPTRDEVKPGMVLRMMNDDDHLPPFSDCLVLKVELARYQSISDRQKRYTVHLARPYIYGSLLNTACPNVLTGVENFNVDLDMLCDRFKMVLDGRGEPMRYET